MEVPFYFYLNALAIFLWLIYRKRFQVNLTAMGYYLVFCFACESLAWLYSYFTYKSNHWIYNIYTTLQVVFLCYLYERILPALVTKKMIRIFAFAYPVLVCLNVFFVQSFYKFHTYTYVFGCVFIIILVFSYFNRMLHSNEVISLRKNPFFWFNLGNMIYFIGSIFYMGSINFILETGHDRYGHLINIFVYLFTSIQYGCFSIALLCYLKPANLL